MHIDGLILAGGANKRFGGIYKGDLLLDGVTFTRRIASELSEIAEQVWVSYGTADRGKVKNCRIVYDRFPGCGPLAGIEACLAETTGDAVCVCACDMPYMKADFFRFLLGCLEEAEQEQGMRYDGVVPELHGLPEPLAAIYRKKAGPVFCEQIRKGQCKARKGLARLKILYVCIDDREDLIPMLENINTMTAYKRLREKPVAAAVCGVKNSGKTTLLVKLVRELTGRGLRIAVIKHDGHDFVGDVPGTDSFRFQEAGAYGTAVYSSQRYLVQKQTEKIDLQDLIAMFPEADVILVEGHKDSDLPKIEVVRSAVSKEPVSNPNGRFLVVTDLPAEQVPGDTAGLDDIELIADRILALGGEERETNEEMGNE